MRAFDDLVKHPDEVVLVVGVGEDEAFLGLSEELEKQGVADRYQESDDEDDGDWGSDEVYGGTHHDGTPHHRQDDLHCVENLLVVLCGESGTWLYLWAMRAECDLLYHEIGLVVAPSRDLLYTWLPIMVDTFDMTRLSSTIRKAIPTEKTSCK